MYKISLFDENLDKKVTYEVSHFVKKQRTGEILMIINHSNGMTAHFVTDHVSRQSCYDQKYKTFFDRLLRTD